MHEGVGSCGSENVRGEVESVSANRIMTKWNTDGQEAANNLI